jgi:hypothetical protein
MTVVAAATKPSDSHAITNLESLDISSELLNHSNHFVSRDSRKGVTKTSKHIGMAKSAGGNLDENLSKPGLGDG